jgi:hypothetical protein
MFAFRCSLFIQWWWPWACPLVIAGSRIFPHHSPFPPREQWLAMAVQGAVVEVYVVEVVDVVDVV